MAERQFGPYRLVRQIAVGGMAEIHLAKTKGIAGFEKYVALKMIHPNFAEDEQFIQMLVDEAKIAVQLNHGNIAQTFDLGRVGDTFYITMEFVDGADLYKILRRGSEVDIEMPLDVCAFVGKEVASALDHAHRKRDHAGKSLGIVHRDVSPQNVLISYAGEVKLVDFGIAKATMKARQTAVGVIKGKYYYMSPEQAWGDPIDHRSDIFSAGIVLYEMITGQMLYLEEDLQKLLDMARTADIASPSTLRKGIPPQLERIVMHALAKMPGERYQSASDLASDLERFLHAYSPVFTATKLAGLMKQILGDPERQQKADYEVEVRDGKLSTVNPEELIHDKEEIRDENSVIFRVADLEPKQPPPKPIGSPTGRVTRQSGLENAAPPRPQSPSKPPGQIPKIARPTPPVGAPQRAQPTPPRAQPVAEPPRPAPRAQTPRPPSKPPRGMHDETVQVVSAPGVNSWSEQDHEETLTGQDNELDNIGERTMISAAPGMQNSGFMMDAGEDGIDATMITGAPQAPDSDDEEDEPETLDGSRAASDDLPVAGHGDDDDDAPTHTPSDEDGPTMQRDPFPKVAKPRATGKRGPAPPALAAKIHAPAVSELRKPRASRRTPPGGVAQQANVLQQMIGAQANEPMPSPAPSRSNRNEDSSASTLPQQPSPVAGRALAMAQKQQPPAPSPPQQPPFNGQPNPYGTDASGMPIGLHTPPPGAAVQMVPGVPPHLQPYANQQPPPYAQQYPGYPPPQYQQPYPPPQYGNNMSPGALYQFQPAGAPPAQPMSLTGQMRLFEADEIPSQYKVARSKWLLLVIAGLLAISIAAGATVLILNHLRDAPPTIGSVHIESAPAGADVYWDNSKLDKKTPVTVDGVPVGSRHEVRVEMPGHATYTESVLLPKKGGEIPVMAMLKVITGKIRVVTHPDGAEIRIDGEVRGRAPTTLNDIDLTSARQIELRLKEYQPYIQPLAWPANGEIDLDIKLMK
ncbi:MAG: serine/threonine protein kinase [Myxococcales bacterium]|nr:serine/threonine protein kinase [Myxococcales bacterium]